MPQPLLAIDSVGAACSAAVWRDGALAASRLEAMSRGQSERILPLVEAAMRAAAQDYAGLAAIAVTTGPGGFTGARIGLAAARGLALACGVPAIGVGSFLAQAAATLEEERQGRRLWVALDSRRAEIYLQAFSASLDPEGEPLVCLPEDIPAALGGGAVLLCGDAAARAAETAARACDLLVSAAPAQAQAAVVARLVAGWPLPAPDAAPPRPVYLRPPDVTLPRGAGGG
ncbi:MAG: tRNA (adenosine(37)-N6)-threonylcarbamoyltransferase complex dimerization subunit type 1 TsaB [Rhodovibrionaceae bacterium]